MKKFFLPLCLSALVVTCLHAQPLPCGPTPEMTSFCDEACIICDIDGFTGINDDPAQGQAPPGFCTNNVHHMQWIGFIAGSTNLTLEVSVFNCQQGEGLEVGIYRSLDCQTFQLVSNCDTDLPPNTTTTFSNTVPLVVGQYYFFVMDGNMGDVCNYTIKVVSGTTNVSALSSSGALNGIDKTCVETPTPYTVTAPLGGTWFEWSLDGEVLGSGPDTSVVVTWTAPGLHELCVTTSNTCDTAPPSCREIVVHGIAPTFLQATICEGECYGVGDTVVCDDDIYQFHYTGSEGCDSLVQLDLEVLPVLSSTLNLLICNEDSVFVGGQPYFESGNYQKILTSANGCDSIVNLNLTVIQCEIQGDFSTTAAACNGSSNGAVQFSIADGTPPFQYSWQRVPAGAPAGIGSIATLNQAVTLGGLPAGTYFITVSDNFGNDVILFGDVAEPPPLMANVQIKDYNGFQISCKGLKDGAVTLNLSGGVPPYTTVWNNGQTATQLQNLGAGTYQCTVTDASGCSVVVEAILNEPEALEPDILFEKPGCDGASTGSIRVVSVDGGTAPYTYALSGNNFGTLDEFDNLPAGQYSLTVRDANGCTIAESAVFPVPLIPQIDLGDDLSIDLGESTLLQLNFNVPLDSFAWVARPGLSCYDCPQPEARPFTTTTYTLTVRAPGGCTDTDSVTVVVLAKRDVYVPNIFSPDDDGHNELFTVYGGPEVLIVRTLQVYSRWGELMFRRDLLAANDEQGGWDGTFRGKAMPPGVYTWIAEVEFLDGVVLEYQGTITVLR